MRVAVVRSDLTHFYLADVENASQRDFSAEPAGQSRYFHYPTDAELTAVLAKYSITTVTLPLATLRTAVYGGATPPFTTVNVASATLAALAGISGLVGATQTAAITDLQNLIAPSLVETGPALLSFANGQLSKLRNAAFQPGGARAGLSAHQAVAIVANDGSTAFSL